MAKKKQADGQLSLFDDTFFDTPPRTETEPGGERPSESSAKDAFSMDFENAAMRRSEEAERKGSVVRVETPPSGGCVNKDSERIRVRGKRLRLRATFDDGTVICDASATQTMIETIRKIGVERVSGLGMEVCHIPLVSREITPRYAHWTKSMGDGWYLMAQSDTRQKYMQLVSVIGRLGAGVKVELADFDAVGPCAVAKPETRRKRKAQMEVTVGGRTISHGSDMVFTFLDVVELIGVGKVKKTGITVGRFPIVARDKTANNQIQASTGEWITVPATAKDKYKVLRVISSMTHTPLEIKMSE